MTLQAYAAGSAWCGLQRWIQGGRGPVLGVLACVFVAAAIGITTSASAAGTQRRPTMLSRPVISGAPRVGDVLIASPGRWSRAGRFSFRWRRCDASGSQCTRSSFSRRSYRVTQRDVGHTLEATVVARNASGRASATSRATAPVPSRPYQSVLFWLAWDGGQLKKIRWNAVTQVNLFSLATCTRAAHPYPDCTGPSSLSETDNGVSNVGSFVSTVHRHRKLALISIGGSGNPNWYYPCNPSTVAAFASNLVGYMKANGFDGIDLDIEQDAGTGNPALTAADLQACTKAVYEGAKAVKTALGATPLITSDVDPTTNFDIGQIQDPYVDQFNAMSYGARGAALRSQIAAHEMYY